MLIGLTGYANSGKDTVADILVRDHGFKRYAFADKLRELALAINPSVWCENHGTYYDLRVLVKLYGWDYAKRKVPEVRELLQRVGAWHRENCGPDFWVGFVARQFYADGQPNAVVTDVRFANEAQWIGDALTADDAGYGHVIRITRPGVGPVNGDVSERLEFDVDAEINNAGDLEDLRRAVDSMAQHLAIGGVLRG